MNDNCAQELKVVGTFLSGQTIIKVTYVVTL